MTRAKTAFAAAVGLGAGLMYYLDPDRGSRRRTRARNQIRRASNQLRQTSKQLRNGPGIGERLRTMGADRLRTINETVNGSKTRRVATALAGVAGIGMAARAAMHSRQQPFELRS